MIGSLAVSVIGLLLDDRTVNGEPVWLKPFKFSVSVGIYAFTLAWLLSLLCHRFARRVGTVTTVVVVIEMVIIIGQAPPRHGEPFQQPRRARRDPVPRHGRVDRRAVGGQPRDRRPRAAAAFRRAVRAVGHPHRLGCRISSACTPCRRLPLLALALRRFTTLAESLRTHLVVVAGADYAGWELLVTWQALRGQSLITPDPLTLAALGALVAFVTTGVTVALLADARRRQPEGVLV